MSKALNINDEDFTNQIGALPSIGGIVEVDQPFTRDFDGSPTYSGISVFVGTGAPTNTGVLILEDFEGKPVVWTGVASGQTVYLAKCRRVLSSAVTPKGTFTMTCQNMTWEGGAR